MDVRRYDKKGEGENGEAVCRWMRAALTMEGRGKGKGTGKGFARKGKGRKGKGFNWDDRRLFFIFIRIITVIIIKDGSLGILILQMPASARSSENPIF